MVAIFRAMISGKKEPQVSMVSKYQWPTQNDPIKYARTHPGITRATEKYQTL